MPSTWSPATAPSSTEIGLSSVLEEDAAYLQALAEHGVEAELPDGRRSAAQRELHRENAATL